jgi:signal transduction histidine kinase/CheY-like chemotaxis protein
MTTHGNQFARPIDIDSAARFAGLFFAYLITARIGLDIHAVNTFATFIWPPSGIALAGFILYGWRVWPAIFCAAFLVNVSIGASMFVALGIALGNTFAPAVGASLLKWYTAYTSDHPTFPRLRDNIGIILSAMLIPVATATIGSLCLLLGNGIGLAAFAATWSTWWIGDLLGILILTPFILKWFNRPLFERTLVQQIELLLAFTTVVVTSYVIFWMPHTAFLYYIFIPLTWAALRTGPRGVTLSVLAVACISVSGTLAGHGPFAADGLIFLQLFLITVSSILLIFSSTVEERRNVFETLQQRADDLEIALETIRSEDEAKKEFIGVLAHELRNPLATILSSIELINLQGVAAANTSLLLTTIDERSRAMVRLLDNLLDISRISKKKLTLQKETISVTQFIDSLESIVRPLMKRYGHEFALVRPAEDLYLRADPVRLEQICMNLLANAARYTKARGAIEVVIGKEEQKLAIHIRDSGVGIPRGMLRRVFEPFFHVDRSQVSSEGLGIGLTLTRELVEMHGGSIEARSGGIGTGSEFIIRLPLMGTPKEASVLPVMSSSPARTQTQAHTARLPKHTHKILIVDDNKDAADALSQLLEIRGNSTAIAYSGAEAVEKALQFEPEVVFLDIGLPDMSGYDVALKLRAQGKPYFLIALTGYGQDDDISKAKKSGIDQHLTKPAGFKEIQAVLRKFPRSRRDTENV